MKYTMLCLAFIIFCNHSRAQRTKEQRFEDSVIGWDAKKKFDHYLKPQTTPAGKQKEVYVNTMAEWVMKSYTPVGSLGEYVRYVNDYGFGLTLSTWNVGYDYLDEQKHFRPIPEENVPYYFTANRVYGAFDIDFMNKGADKYFTMQPNDYTSYSTEKDKRKNIKIDANAAKYFVWINDWVTIYLAPGNQLPMQPVSRGELLDKAETSLDDVLKENRKQINSQWPDNVKAQEEAFDYSKKEVDKYRGNIRTLKTKYKDKLDEPATVVDMQLTWRGFSADNWDVFNGAPNSKLYPVYKFTAATKEKMKAEKPVWIAVALPYKVKEDGNSSYELFTAMTQNLNYDYIYNYFFAPEKNAGKNYTPANEDLLKARLAAYKNASNNHENTAAKKQLNLLSNVLLFDNFSQENIGSKPGGWYFSNTALGNIVSKADGMDGQWLKLGYNNAITSTTIKTLPQNFDIEFDLVTGKFSDRWGGEITFEMYGTKKGSDGVQYASTVELKLTAGLQSALDANHDYRGNLNMKLINTPSAMEYNDRGGYFDFAQPVFTDTKRKVQVKLEKKENKLFVFLNNKQVAASTDFKTRYGKSCGDCSIPAVIQYDKFSIKNSTNDADNIGCYISNIKITKL